jgi:hypothetical protein
MHKFLNLFCLSIHFCLTCCGISFNPSSEAGVQVRRQWFKSLGYGVSALVLTLYPGYLNHCWNCTPPSEDGLKENPKYVRQKWIDNQNKFKNLWIKLMIIQFHSKMARSIQQNMNAEIITTTVNTVSPDGVLGVC